MMAVMRPKRRWRSVALGASLALSLAGVAAHGQGSGDSPASWASTASEAEVDPTQAGEGQSVNRETLARQIRQKLATLRSLRDQRERARQTHQQKLSALQQQVDRLERDLERVRDEVEAAKQQNEQRDAALSQARARQERARQVIDAAQAAAKPVARAMGRRVEHGVPFDQKKRTNRLQSIEQTLAADSGVDRAKGVIDLFGFAGSEFQRASSIELINRPVLLDGGQRRKHAHVLRLGLAGGAFVSEDGETVALAAPGDGNRWRFDLSDEQRRRVREAVAIRREEAVPALVSFPWPIGQSAADSGSASQSMPKASANPPAGTQPANAAKAGAAPSQRSGG